MAFLFILSHHFTCCYIFVEGVGTGKLLCHQSSERKLWKKGVLPSWNWPFVIIRELFVKNRIFFLADNAEISNTSVIRTQESILDSFIKASLLTFLFCFCFLPYHISTILCTPTIRMTYSLSRKQLLKSINHNSFFFRNEKIKGTTMKQWTLSNLWRNQEFNIPKNPSK